MPPREIEPAPPHIYHADNAAFAAGVDRGQRLDAGDSVEVLMAVRDRLRASSPFGGSTVSIRHHDGFLGLDIRADEDLCAVSKLATGLVRYGRPFAAYADAWGTDSDAVDNFERYYQGSLTDSTRLGPLRRPRSGVRTVDRLVTRQARPTWEEITTPRPLMKVGV